MLIYRIALRDNPKIGVFHSGDAYAAQDQAYEEDVFDPWRHPSDAIDVQDRRSHTVCGFQSLEVYRIWFVTPGVRAALYRSGRSIMRVYDVPDSEVRTGMVQCTFRLDDAISVREATPEEMA